MPFAKDPGTQEDPRYCSYCFNHNEFTYKGNDLKKFQQLCKEAMEHSGMHPWKARFFAWMIRFAPRWKTPPKK